MIRKTTRQSLAIAELLEVAEKVPPEVISAVALPYQLTSSALQDPVNIAAWRTSGRLVAFGLLQVPFNTLFYGVELSQLQVESEVFNWGIQRAREFAKLSGRPFRLSVWPPESASGTRQTLQEAGFSPAPGRKVLLQRDLTRPIAEPELPAGFALRHLSGVSDIERVVAMTTRAFDGDTTLDFAWRTRIVEHPQYVPELDLLVVDSEGNLASSCLCWISRTRQVGQIEPMGTDPVFWRRGLAKATALEGLRRMRDMGARRAFVGTSGSNIRSQALYHSIGYELISQQVEYVFEAEAANV